MSARRLTRPPALRRITKLSDRRSVGTLDFGLLAISGRVAQNPSRLLSSVAAFFVDKARRDFTVHVVQVERDFGLDGLVHVGDPGVPQGEPVFRKLHDPFACGGLDTGCVHKKDRHCESVCSVGYVRWTDWCR